MDNNIRTMEFLGIDEWDRPVYKCKETGMLFKDMTLGSENPELYSCGNCFDGEPGWLIKPSLEIRFDKKYVIDERQFDYQMLDRLRSDCDYYLGYGDRCKSRLYYHDEKEHINRMKELYNSFPDDKKPEWLTYEQILKYEEAMLTA